MIVPIGDVSKSSRVPFINYALLAANIAVFAWQVQQPKLEAVLVHALVPARWTLETLFTSMFLHGDLWHLLGNMLFLWIVGDNVEDKLGHLGYGLFYLVAGLAGAAAHVLTDPASSIPCVGASGAISGVMGAYLVFFPTGKIRFLVLIFMKTFTSPAWYAIGLWVALQVLMARAQMNGQTTNVAVFAHLGGFAFGFAAALLLRLLGFKQKNESK